MKCPHCGGEHPDTANFCPKSGKKLSESFIKCSNPDCQAENIPNTFTFCPHCGTPLNAQSLLDIEEVNLRMALGEGGTDMENPEGKFLMVVVDVFNITGRGVVVTGEIAAGKIKVGDRLELLGYGKSFKVKTSGIELNRKLVDIAVKGDIVGIFISGVDYQDVLRGSVLTERRFLRNGLWFQAHVYMFSETEGGRSESTGSDYTPCIYIRNMEVPGLLTPVYNAMMGIRPGENAEVVVKLTFSLPMKEGTRFAIRENGRTVGAGIVTKIID